jgi:carotenoid cleavage dioxygenase-like enzyme
LTHCKYLSGNFAPVRNTLTLTTCDFHGDIPKNLAGVQYVRNGGDLISNDELSRDAHWFDGDGMLAGVLFERSKKNGKMQPRFVNRPILTDVYLFANTNTGLKTLVLPSVSTLIDSVSSLMRILGRILRTIFLTIISFLPGSNVAIKKISVANTGIVYHDGRVLTTCESGPPTCVQLPELDTVGCFDGNFSEGEFHTHEKT